MKELYSHYTPKEQDEIFDNWANHVSATDPTLAEKIVRNIVEHESPQLKHCTNADTCGNTFSFTNPDYAASLAEQSATTVEPDLQQYKQAGQ